MKKNIQIVASLVLSLLLISCKKEPAAASKTNLTFNYNGKHYVLTYDTQGVQNWGAGNIGLYIDRPDLFNGRINFLKTGCAYLYPAGLSVYSTDNCELHYSDLSPIDSNSVYVYKSGSLNITYSNCHTKSGYDIVTGTNYTNQICDLSGAFDLILINKNNQVISITEGIIKIYNLMR